MKLLRLCWPLPVQTVTAYEVSDEVRGLDSTAREVADGASH